MDFECRTHKNLDQGCRDWMNISIFVLLIYSTIFSGIWLVLAILKPRYGKKISVNGTLRPAEASLLCAIIAKSIELSFVTVFVAFLGQVLSRRAFIKNSKGISIAEMSMRAWVMQPGTLFTQGSTIWFTELSILGIFSLIAALAAMLYTTASDGLGQ